MIYVWLRLWFIIYSGSFSIFLYLLGEVVTYLCYSKQPEELNWWIHSNHISQQGRKRRSRKKTPPQISSRTFCEIFKGTRLPLQLHHWYFAEDFAELIFHLSRLHYSLHTKYTQWVDKPMIYAMITSEADIRELIW